MSTIANAAILFSINAAGVQAGLKGLGGAVTGIGSSLGAMGAAASKAFAILVPVIGISKLISMSVAIAENVDRMDELSIKTGISTEALSRLGYAAQFSSLDIETVASSVNKMQKALNEAQGKSGSIFSSIGLDAKKLAGESPEQAFGQIADAINALASPSDRAVAAMQIFGKEGANLLPFLAEGSEGFKKLGAESDAFGNTVSAVDAANTARMVDQFGKLKSAFNGAIQTIVVEAAPMITALLEKITAWLASGPGVVGVVTQAFETFLEVIATGADYLNLFNSGLKYMQALAAIGFAKMVDDITAVADALNLILGSSIGKQIFGGFTIDTSSLHDFSDGFKELSNDLAAEGDAAFDSFVNGDNATKVEKFFADLRASANKASEADIAGRKGTGAGLDLDGLAENANKIQEIMSKLKTDIAEFGLTENEKLQKQLETLGASPKALAEAKNIMDQLDDLNKNKALDDEAKKVLESIQTPAEKAQEEIAKLDTLLDAGKLSWEQYQTAVDNVNGPKKIDIQKPDLFESGSQQARRLSLDLSRGIDSGQIAETKKSNNFLEQIAKQTKGLTAPTPSLKLAVI